MSGFEFVAADEVGVDPFVAGAAEPVPVDFVEISDDLAQAADQAEETVEEQAVAAPVSESGSASASEPVVDPAATIEARQSRVIEVAEEAGLEVTRPGSRLGVGVYGGSGENVCDVAGMVGFFADSLNVADAWAGVHGIGPDEIEGYLGGLTAGYLLDDYDVVNHRLVDAAAEPFDATLEAGTAVLVDDDGIPRVRCLCGNPLLPRLFEYDGRAYESDEWADAVTEFVIADDVGGGRRERQNAIGMPDYDDSKPEDGFGEFTYVALGNADEECEFMITVQFIDNRIINGPGADIRVFEIGATYVGGTTEPFSVWIEVGGEFIKIGEGGDVAEFDIAGFAQGPIDTLKICDLPESFTASPWPGPDIDAIAAINSALP